MRQANRTREGPRELYTQRCKIFCLVNGLKFTPWWTSNGCKVSDKSAHRLWPKKKYTPDKGIRYFLYQER